MFLPCPALRPHACLGLHKGHIRATAEVGAVRRRRGLPPRGPPGRPQAVRPGLGSRRRLRPERGRRPALPLPLARTPRPAQPLRLALGQRSHRSSSSSTGSGSGSGRQARTSRMRPQRGTHQVGRDTRGPGPGRETAVLGATPRLESPSTRQRRPGSRRTQTGPRGSGGAPWAWETLANFAPSGTIARQSEKRRQGRVPVCTGP